MTIVNAEGRITFDATGNTEAEVSKFLVYGFNWTGAANAEILTIDDQDDVALYDYIAETGQLERDFVFPKPIPVTQLKVTMSAGTSLVVYI